MVTQIKTKPVCVYKKHLTFCFWSKIYVKKFFFSAEKGKKIQACQSQAY